jgi:adenosylhomocysteine nucleosidase
MALLAVTGMQAEARIARDAGLPAIVIGGGATPRLVAVERAIADGATALVSFGVAGALDPALRPGTILLPEAVILPSGDAIPCSPWFALSRPFTNGSSGDKKKESSMARPNGAMAGSIYGGDTIISGVRAKQSQFRQTGALAVDLESGIVARAAARAGIPFFVLRAVADPASSELPPAALVGLHEDGRPALLRVVASALRRPTQVPALIQLALDTRAALSALTRGTSTIFVPNPLIETL